MTIFTTRPTCRKRATLRIATALTIISAILSLAPAGWAGSIFDDDYTPPKRVEPAPTPGPNPSPSVPSDTHQPVPPAHPPDVAAPTPSPEVQSVHRSIPDKASRSKCRKLFEEVYAKELKDRAPDARRKLSQTLLTEAGKAAEGSPDRFVLLNGAMQAAEEARSLDTGFSAADDLARGYEVDGLAVKIEFLKKALSGTVPAGSIDAENAETLFALTEALVRDDDFGDLAEVETILQHVLPGISDPALKSDAKNEIRDIGNIRQARQRITPMLARLLAIPDDPEANLAVGGFYCFECDRWDKGLPLLAKSSDAQLKQLAASDLATPAS